MQQNWMRSVSHFWPRKRNWNSKNGRALFNDNCHSHQNSILSTKSAERLATTWQKWAKINLIKIIVTDSAGMGWDTSTPPPTSKNNYNLLNKKIIIRLKKVPVGNTVSRVLFSSALLYFLLLMGKSFLFLSANIWDENG